MATSCFRWRQPLHTCFIRHWWSGLGNRYASCAQPVTEVTLGAQGDQGSEHVEPMLKLKEAGVAWAGSLTGRRQPFLGTEHDGLARIRRQHRPTLDRTQPGAVPDRGNLWRMVRGLMAICVLAVGLG
jgi:hypothetical protein